MSEVYEIADAVAAVLAAGTWPNGVELTPQRVYLPTIDLATMEVGDLKVFVIIKDSEISPSTRDSRTETPVVGVVVIQKLSADDDVTGTANPTVDGLLALCRAIAFGIKPGEKIAGATFTGSKYPVVYDAEPMKSDHVFFAVVDFNFFQTILTPN